ncbi:zinc finger protein 64-like protein, isoforms 3 and 4-like [Platysternon megacephalum]|uniref:Zinc finger protein 64-like protein, isoforms 3 and 4-like n=1 Tax=Platysternon megacephalum TaxID=55544 RepID=A0A4D9DET7_9SAUR|nr:zinc finger protein 64-like protein, isoforms 3 and 4-like [Platysternon megacephalum]
MCLAAERAPAAGARWPLAHGSAEGGNAAAAAAPALGEGAAQGERLPGGSRCGTPAGKPGPALLQCLGGSGLPGAGGGSVIACSQRRRAGTDPSPPPLPASGTCVPLGGLNKTIIRMV